MTEQAYDVILITDDAHLRDAVQHYRPAGARLLCLSPDEWDQRSDVRAKQVWVDAASRPQRPITSAEPATYIYSDRDQFPQTLSPCVVLRKHDSDGGSRALWSRVRLDRAARTTQRDDALLPAWLLDLHALELASVLGRIVEVLPARLGYKDVSIYLFDPALNALTLARTTRDTAVELTLPCPRGEIATAEAGPDRSGGALVIPLVDRGQLEGSIRLEHPQQPPVALEPAVLDGIAAFLGRLVAHAQVYERVRAEGRIDSLTGLFNYRWIHEVLAKEVRRAQRFRTPLSLIAIDVDRLKQTNDRYGHAAGNTLLRHIAARISACLRQIDSAARVGGDEFMAVLPRTNLRGARHVADRILATLRDDPPVRADSVSVSIGLSELRPGWNVQRLVETADKAMYQAKRSGGNRAIAFGRLQRHKRATTPTASRFHIQRPTR